MVRHRLAERLRLTLGGRLRLTLGGRLRLTLGAMLLTARLISSARATVKGWTNRTPTPFVWIVFTFVSSLVLPISALALTFAFIFSLLKDASERALE